MSLLDSDNDIIRQNQEKSGGKKSKRKAKTSGLNRFANSLNKYKKYANEHREKVTPDTKEQTTVEALNKPKEKIEAAQLTPIVIKKDSVSVETTLKQKPIPIETDSAQIEITDNVKKEVIKMTSPSSLTKKYVKPKDNQLDNNTLTVKEHLGNESDNNEITSGYLKQYEKITFSNRLDNRKDNQLDNNIFSKRAPLNPVANETRNLVGQCKQLLDIFFSDCQAQGSLTTGRFTTEFLSDSLETTPNQIKTLIHRLSKKGIVNRLPGKRGRSGWTQVQLPQSVYEQLTDRTNNPTLNGIKEDLYINKITNKITEKITTASSSSSSILNNNLTTTTESLPDEWNYVQIPEGLKTEGFSMAHVKQLARDGVFTPDEVQESFENFLYDLQSGAVKPRLGSVRFFMGVLKKQRVPYISQTLIEQEKKELEEYSRKIAEARETKKEQTEIALVKKFEDWWNVLSQEQKNDIATPSQYSEEGSDMQERIARGIFLEDQTIMDKF